MSGPGSAAGHVAGRRTAALLKRVDLRPEVDPLTGELTPDPHGGMSAADRCALALAIATGDDVLAVSAGPASAVEVLREALAAGASRAVWIEMPADAPSDAVAEALAAAVRGCAYVWCGDYSTDRGSGSVPAYVAAHLDAAQALGLSAVDVSPTADGAVAVHRRLDGGRQELLTAHAPAVFSVEAGVIGPVRPALKAVLAAATAPIERVAVEVRERPVGRIAAYRPRSQVLPGPAVGLSPRERLLAMSGALADHEPPRVVHGDAVTAADELLDFLRSRGFYE
jgi:electron transfer flavoprotein beta subunit